MVESNNGETTKLPGGITGKGFMPGQSGNPNGRPLGLAALVRERTKDGQVPIDFLLDVLNGTVKRTKITHRIAAAEALLDRGYGKASQKLEHTGDEGGPIQWIEVVRSDASK